MPFLIYLWCEKSSQAYEITEITVYYIYFQTTKNKVGVSILLFK